MTSVDSSPVVAPGRAGFVSETAGPLAGWLVLLLTLHGCTSAGHSEEIPPPEQTAAQVSTGRLQLPRPSDSGGFTEVTEAAGILARHRLATPDLENIVDAVGAGAAFADLDGDGWLDLVVLGGPRSPAKPAPGSSGGIHLYRNTQDGRFEDVTSASGIPSDTNGVSVAVADIDGDGDRDLFLLDRGPNRLFRNRGDAVFDDVTKRSGLGDARFGVAAVFFDLEGDGDLDLYVANYLDYDPRERNYFAPDGYPGPLAYTAQRDLLYRNRGDGRFEDVSDASGVAAVAGRGMSLAAADFDEDGDTDVFVANDATENFFWLNRGDGKLVESGLLSGVAMGENGEQTSAMAADTGDLDGDGHLDLTVSDTAFGAFYRHLRPGVYVDDVMRSGIGVACGQYVSWGQNLLDFDNDGDLDLFVVNGGLHHLVGWEDLLLANDGHGRFTNVSEQGGPYFANRYVGRGSVVGDYDNDGDLDLFVTTLQGGHHLLRNDAAEDASWITLDLVGVRARDPYGTRVEIQTSGTVRVAECRARTAYLGEGDPRLHFGLGRGIEQVERIRVVWPDGTTGEWSGVPARQIFQIRQGA